MSFRAARSKLCQALFLAFLTTPAATVFAAGVDLGNLDRSVAPCTDFYRFATGHWADTHPVPADRARWGAFDEVEERNRDLLVAILQEAAKANAAAGTPLRKLGDFYASGMAAQYGDAKEGLQAALLVTTSSTYAKSVAGAFALLHAQGARNNEGGGSQRLHHALDNQRIDRRHRHAHQVKEEQYFHRSQQPAEKVIDRRGDKPSGVSLIETQQVRV
ncbi:MAG: hypothetical protein HY255_12455, partial [Betaproteobacteria bacterium]|nr:hypothetical protein [Betaproteobacteria bacterium]